MEQLNIEGKRSGEGFVAHKGVLVSALSRAVADRVVIQDITLGRKGLLGYLKALGGGNVVKVTPSSGSASESQAAEKRLKVICGANTSHLSDGEWIDDNTPVTICQVRVSPSNSVRPNVGAAELATQDGKIHLHAREVEDWMREINPSHEEERLQADEEFPLILNAGRHMDMNANTNMRDPAWNEGRRPCTLAMNPADAENLGLADRQMVKVTTEAGEETIEVEVTEATRRGMVIIPHGFGLVYDGVKRGTNVNRLTKNTHRDRIAATPLHRYVRCRVEAL